MVVVGVYITNCYLRYTSEALHQKVKCLLTGCKYSIIYCEKRVLDLESDHWALNPDLSFTNCVTGQITYSFQGKVSLGI